MTGMQIVNAVQAGDASLASKLAECCCENRLLTTTQGYENRIALAEQTSFLGAKIDNQTNIISDKFCDLEKRELQNKIDALREERSTLLGRISNSEQTNQILAYINSTISPLAADVAAIKCAQPPTVSVPYPTL
jgi:predicted aconitase with swiveling domain